MNLCCFPQEGKKKHLTGWVNNNFPNYPRKVKSIVRIVEMSCSLKIRSAFTLTNNYYLCTSICIESLFLLIEFVRPNISWI